MYACGASSKNINEVPVVKQYSLPSSPTQFIEQSVLICLPAASPTGSSLPNSPCIVDGGTTAFQMPPGSARSSANADGLAINMPPQSARHQVRWGRAKRFMTLVCYRPKSLSNQSSAGRLQPRH